MSFIVQIWEQPEGFPKPTSAVEACNLVDLAAERADPARPNARLKAFQQEIRERWPVTVTTDWDGKRQVDLGVWQDDSLLGDLGAEPSVTLGIARSHIGAVLPWLAEAGPLAGVNVADPQNGSAYLADGSVFALSEEGACAKALARHFEVDDRGAWERFVELAQQGNRFAFGKLGEMYADARFVGRDPALSLALRAIACDWRLVGGVATRPEGPRSHDSSSLSVARDDAGAELVSKADALFAQLHGAPDLRQVLLAAAHEFDARHVAALDLVDKGDFAAAAMRLQPLANRGHAPSQRALARLWSTGRATPDDPKQELAWITAAAHIGDTAALQRLAWLYDEGVLRKRETRNARGVHRLLIRDGETSAVRDASRVALKRLNGPPGGKFWEGRTESELLPLAEQGDADAMVELARVIEWGRSLDQVWERSTPWWIRAAEAGHAQAQRQVAQFHEQGRGVAKDEAKATHWYGLSARQGDGHAEVAYARRLGTGLGIARDDAQARHWLERAARQRIASALAFMARGHANGDLYPKNLLAAQLLVVVHDRLQDWGLDDFHGPDQVDPREVRRLLAEIDAGADLLEVLKRCAPPATPAPPARGLSLAPMTAPAAPVPAPRPTAAPTAAPTPRRPPSPSRDASLPVVAGRRRERAIEPEPELVASPVARSPLGPILILLSFAMLTAVVSSLRKDAGANVTVVWFIGSALAAVGVFQISRENGNTGLVAAMDAAPMFVPFVGSALAARMLYFRWRSGKA